jgi:hypothetical protein
MMKLSLLNIFHAVYFLPLSGSQLCYKLLIVEASKEKQAFVELAPFEA